MSESEGLASVDDAAPGTSGADQAIEDLLRLAHVPGESIDATAIAIASETGFLDGERLRQIVAEKITDEQQANAVVRVLGYFHVDNIPAVLKYLKDWRNVRPRNSQRLPDDVYEEIAIKLPQLVRVYPALDRYRKAQVLSRAIGNIPQTIHLICELRPVFDEARDRVEGLVPVTILRLYYTEQNGQPNELELHMSRPLLDTLVDESTKAQKKLGVLQQTISEWLPRGFVEPK